MGDQPELSNSTGAGNQKQAGWHKVRWLWVVITVVAALVVAFIIALILNRENGPYVLEIGNQKVTQNEYGDLREDAVVNGITGAAFDDQLVEKLTDIAAWQAIGISVSDEEIRQADESLYGTDETTDSTSFAENSWRQLDAEWSALKMKYEMTLAGNYQGAIFFFYFGRYQIQPADGLPLSAFNDTLDPQLLGDAATIQADKDYALEQATAYIQKVKNDPDQLDQYIVAVNDDSRINGYATSRTFGYGDSHWLAELDDPQFETFISSLRQPGVSDLQILRLNTVTGDLTNAETVEAVYWFVYVDDDSAFAAPELSDEFAQQRQVIDTVKIVDLAGGE